MKNLLLAVLLACAGLAGCGMPEPVAALHAEASPVLGSGFVRHDLRFPCGDTNCAGWLYLPEGVERAPVAVLAGGFAGTRDVGLPFFAEALARSGIATFVFDYRNFGASGGAPRQLVDPWAQLDDWKAAVAFVRAHASLDAKRVALWGISLGGGLALVAAARDGNVQAVVAQVPQVDAEMEGEATFPGFFWLARLLFSAFADLGGSAFSAEPLTIAAIAPSGGFGMLPDDEAFAAMKRLAPEGSLYRNEVAARSIFTFDEYNPRVHAAGLSAPVLLIATKSDRFAPFSAVEAYARANANAEIFLIDGDHFDAYFPPQSERAASAGTAFLKRHFGQE